ncbi:hypothetical protein GGD65_008150 [Bradyrhizobium sp. CIR18]|nr:hypothetical protein [Bradyrhizobium sp. CIR18]
MGREGPDDDGQNGAVAGLIKRVGGAEPGAVVFCPSRRLKCCAAPYRPAATKGICGSQFFRRPPRSPVGA